MSDPAQEARQIIARLTGLPAEAFENLDLPAKLKLVQQWHACAVTAEQVASLLLALAMIEDGVQQRELALYLGSHEVTDTSLGRFNFASGICERPAHAHKQVVPLLKAGAWRAFLRPDTARAILNLCCGASREGSRLDPSRVADAMLRLPLSPAILKRTTRTLLRFVQVDPEAVPRLWESLTAVRDQNTSLVANSQDVETRLPEPP